MNGRLLTVASLIRPGSRAADIGTDHALLPVYLVRNGICPFVVASDIREGPLQMAARNVSRTGLTEQITLIRTDGLRGIELFQPDDIVIAGMGGETVARILNEAAWIKDTRIRLLLQPMTKPELLREYLCRNGFAILRERAVRDRGHLYAVMAAAYTGGVCHEPELFFYIGRLTENAGPEERAYGRSVADRLRKKLDGLKKSKDQIDPHDEERLETLIRQIEALIQKQ